MLIVNFWLRPKFSEIIFHHLLDDIKTKIKHIPRSLSPPSTTPKNHPHHWDQTDNNWIRPPTTRSTTTTDLGLLFYLCHRTHATTMRPSHACNDWIVDDTAFSPIDMFFSLYFSCDRQSSVLFFLFCMFSIFIVDLLNMDFIFSRILWVKGEFFVEGFFLFFSQMGQTLENV